MKRQGKHLPVRKHWRKGSVQQLSFLSESKACALPFNLSAIVFQCFLAERLHSQRDLALFGMHFNRMV